MLNISVSAPFVWRCLNVTRTLPDLEELPTRSGATGKTEGPVLALSGPPGAIPNLSRWPWAKPSNCLADPDKTQVARNFTR
jgi:hypothetical protein